MIQVFKLKSSSKCCNGLFLAKHIHDVKNGQLACNLNEIFISCVNTDFQIELDIFLSVKQYIYKISQSQENSCKRKVLGAYK
jgi:hypothetical protein